MSLLKKARSIIRENRRSSPIQFCANMCEKFLRAYYNEDYYDFSRNGEYWVLQCFAQQAGGRSIGPGNIVALDVGAHKGSWTLELLKVLPNSSVFCFEPVLEIAEEGRSVFARDPRVAYVNVALSSEDGISSITRNFVHDSTNSIAPRLGSHLFSQLDSIEDVEIILKKGDSIISELGLSSVDILKIDVEGHEVNVLLGLGELLASEGKPTLIQFEYGQTYIPACHSLYEIYNILEPLGYDIGRLYPNYVDFKPYNWNDDNFRMGNYVAAHRQSKLRTLLGIRGTET